ncbi:23S rRNA (adenine(1618)-N(6))-methyltransferase RlmF [Tenacibaculum jejuense]|uniref:Ribosomal RNA large subunit methyltransferase F n=1 Tax=Tenacibaculum jejuense TaxID=584609 RepID=A0A238UB61_9FLAO|nr:23S rRNA (adenine(1618)-N(6))-methyltransferase RlmF [Tenacibaculum jejuense]SNR15818.1 Ribosomal RNA large subunit methyltransferase F [Tenacibaculum jejuense]
MHSRNLHKDSAYDFEKLSDANPDLKAFTFKNEYQNTTIDFGNPKAVVALNKALLIAHYNVSNWELPEGYLCPPIPSRVDYIHHIADIVTEKQEIKGLDIGVGANTIYCILGSQVYNWKMIGCDINAESIKIAQKNIDFTPKLKKNVSLIHQSNNANIFEGVINVNDYFDFSVCNPPFHNSENEAKKGTLRKLNNLNKKDFELNFGGQANELWCNGGEALFLKRMIKQSTLFKNQVGYFTSLVSKKEHLPKLEKQLSKLKAKYRVIPMQHGNKITRILAWSYIKNF